MKFILATFIIMYSFTIQAQKSVDCLDFHKGTFIVEGDDHNTIIKRRKNTQTEKNKNTKFKDEIIWITDCKYKLIRIKVNRDKTNIVTDFTSFFEIIETGADYYMVHITTDINDFEATVKIIKLK